MTKGVFTLVLFACNSLAGDLDARILQCIKSHEIYIFVIYFNPIKTGKSTFT